MTSIVGSNKNLKKKILDLIVVNNIVKIFVYVYSIAIPSNIFLELRWDMFSIEYHSLCVCFSLLSTYIGICNMFILWLFWVVSVTPWRH